ncbi:3-methyl-2-oxobutanoate dehydrogenase subunit VorB [Intestinibacter bartlettii]|uniref:3-methyl-2-oxobutanoate dehydrogenase subunit VorB n=2 Tax=Intestinibacter TaxID=1505657 RepID=UPI001D026834|nr:3-methyl-2-oxobutanoate dehydrogenase subunit VorB [Intestinibacter bartlettii]MCB5720905.1 3-methyl-2-oxobutanoate dehydrogenase subunit VorB [Intestinibacter bartlettii]
MEKVFIKGNEAIAEAAVRAGCRFFAGYPITPQNEIPEYLSRRLPEVGGCFVQGESEVASINMVFGAASTGTRAMTSSSGPGLSLKSEGLSALAGAQLPAVAINVMRGGPGIGSIQAAQMDYLQATKASGHGGFRMIVFAPSTVQEAVDLTVLAFDKAMEYQAPMLVSVDGCIGSIMEQVTLPEMKDASKKDLKFISSDFMNPKRKLVTSCIPVNPQQEYLNKKLAEMYELWNEKEIKVEEYMIDDAEYVFVAYGTSARVAKSVIKQLREKGEKVGLIRPITLYPFSYDSLKKLDSNKVKKVICIELSIPVQVVEDVKIGIEGRIPIETYGRSAGIIFTPEEVIEFFESVK